VRDRLCADGVECVWAECQASAVQEETLVVVWAVLAGVVCVSLAAWGKRTPRYRRFVMLHRIRRAKPLMTQRWKPDGEAVDVPLGAGLSDEQLRSLRQSLGWLQAALDVVNEQQSRRTGYSQMLLRTPKYTPTPIRTPHRSRCLRPCWGVDAWLTLRPLWPWVPSWDTLVVSSGAALLSIVRKAPSNKWVCW